MSVRRILRAHIRVDSLADLVLPPLGSRQTAPAADTPDWRRVDAERAGWTAASQLII
jgi:hypothetical protein